MQTVLINNDGKKEYRLYLGENMETKPCCEKCKWSVRNDKPAFNDCVDRDCLCHLPINPFGTEPHPKESPVSQSVEERESELKKLYEETNIKALVEEMEKDAEEYGQYHDDDCPLNREGGSDFGDVCECEKIRALKTLAREWMGKVNRMWVVNVQNHRKYCSPRGNKELTKIKDKINGSELSRSTTLSTLVKEMEGLKNVDPRENRHKTHPGISWDKCEACVEDYNFNAGISAAVEVVKKMVS